MWKAAISLYSVQVPLNLVNPSNPKYLEWYNPFNPKYLEWYNPFMLNQ